MPRTINCTYFLHHRVYAREEALYRRRIQPSSFAPCVALYTDTLTYHTQQIHKLEQTQSFRKTTRLYSKITICLRLGSLQGSHALYIQGMGGYSQCVNRYISFTLPNASIITMLRLSINLTSSFISFPTSLTPTDNTWHAFGTVPQHVGPFLLDYSS